ncbi:hypothetical protein AVEN_120908-1, partial [Araneus ventricosus]
CGVRVLVSKPGVRGFEIDLVEDVMYIRFVYFKIFQGLETSRWCGVEVRRGDYRPKCRPHHLTLVQDSEVRQETALVLTGHLSN